MNLSSFEIKNYKVIDDTGPVKIDPKVTAFVGKNESGKTGILKALWKSRNVAGAKFVKLDDYPRNRYTRDREGKQQITKITFELLPEDQSSFAEAVPTCLTAPTTVALSTWYEGAKVCHAVSFNPELVFGGGDTALAALEALRGAVKATDEDESTIALQQEIDKALEQVETSEALFSSASIAALEMPTKALNAWWKGHNERETRTVTERQAWTDALTQAKSGDGLTRANDWAEENLPTFIYFDEYGQLETEIHLPTYLSLRKDPSNAKARTQTALFAWSHLDPEEILRLGHPKKEQESYEDVHRRLEERSVLLESASFELSGDWTSWWTGEGHRLVFSADGDYLKLRVSDKDNPFPIPFGERSRGFQWFFSFYLVFLVESEKAHKDAILLLDEPGLHLHPTLQEKLIGLFERISKENQLLYSTHLPFLIDGDHFERIRTVYLSNSEPPKTLVSNELRPAGDRATLFPLQAALGYSIAQTLFIGKSTLIVEGISDFWMLKALDARLSSLGDQDTLNKDIVLIPAGGTSRLMPLASIMLASMSEAKGRLLVLLDSDTEGEQAASRLEKNFDHEAPVVMLGAALGMEFATIEDLVPRPQYAAALKKVLGRTFTLDAKENAAPTNVKAIGLLFHRKGWGELTIDQKAAVALELIAEWGNDPSSVLTETLDLARKLFRELNQRFSG